ncbi:hypothetical protein 10KY502B_gene0028 [Xanthomonas phage 10KY502B]|nr:hypothetical protein 10KY502B_gene0028 [Xanthomonas phage 10KY502B]
MQGMNEQLKEAVSEAIREALGGALDCGRAWSAWGVGTMSEDDFSPVADDSERVAEIADAVLAALAAQLSPGGQGDALVDTARRNIRQFISKASFSSAVDKQAALSCVDVLEEAIAARQPVGELVAYQARGPRTTQWEPCDRELHESAHKADGVETRALYTAPPVPAAVPDGWVLVPRKLTSAMRKAAGVVGPASGAVQYGISDKALYYVWEAFLSNAPEAPPQTGPAAPQGVDLGRIEKALREACEYVGQRSDGDLPALAERCELWIRESRVLIDSMKRQAAGI